MESRRNAAEASETWNHAICRSVRNVESRNLPDATLGIELRWGVLVYLPVVAAAEAVLRTASSAVTLALAAATSWGQVLGAMGAEHWAWMFFRAFPALSQLFVAVLFAFLKSTRNLFRGIPGNRVAAGIAFKITKQRSRR